MPAAAGSSLFSSADAALVDLFAVHRRHHELHARGHLTVQGVEQRPDRRQRLRCDDLDQPSISAVRDATVTSTTRAPSTAATHRCAATVTREVHRLTSRLAAVFDRPNHPARASQRLTDGSALPEPRRYRRR
jgi:hypothetical protein